MAATTPHHQPPPTPSNPPFVSPSQSTSIDEAKELGANGSKQSNDASQRGAQRGTKDGVAVVDVEHRRYEDVELVLDRLVGKGESFALARMPFHKRQALANFMALTRHFMAGDEHKEEREQMLTWALDQVKAHLSPQKGYETALDNLTRQTGEKAGFLDRILGRNKREE